MSNRYIFMYVLMLSPLIYSSDTTIIPTVSLIPTVRLIILSQPCAITLHPAGQPQWTYEPLTQTYRQLLPVQIVNIIPLQQPILPVDASSPYPQDRFPRLHGKPINPNANANFSPNGLINPPIFTTRQPIIGPS